MTYDEARAALMAKVLELGTDEVRVLDCIAGRLLGGAASYGQLDLKKPRPWQKEASEEVFDLAVYLSCAVLSQLDRQ